MDQLGLAARRIAAEVNGTKGRVADLERPRPPVAYPHGSDLCWSGETSYDNGNEAIGLGRWWVPHTDITVESITVVTVDVLTCDLVVFIDRDGIDSSGSVTHPAGAKVGTYALPGLWGVAAGQAIRPQLVCTPADTDAGLAYTIILRARGRANWWPSAGLIIPAWQFSGGG